MAWHLNGTRIVRPSRRGRGDAVTAYLAADHIMPDTPRGTRQHDHAGPFRTVRAIQIDAIRVVRVWRDPGFETGVMPGDGELFAHGLIHDKPGRTLGPRGFEGFLTVAPDFISDACLSHASNCASMCASVVRQFGRKTNPAMNSPS